MSYHGYLDFLTSLMESHIINTTYFFFKYLDFSLDIIDVELTLKNNTLTQEKLAFVIIVIVQTIGLKNC